MFRPEALRACPVSVSELAKLATPGHHWQALE